MKDLLTEEIKAELDEIQTMQLGSKEWETAVKGASELVGKVIELDKLEAEKANKLRLEEQDKLKNEQVEIGRQDQLLMQAKQLELQQKQFDLQAKQQKQNARNNTLTLLVTIGTTLLTAGLTVWGTNTTLDFEKENTVTSSAGKGFLGRLFTKK